MKLIYLKSVLKYNSFDVAIDIKIPFFWNFGYYGAGSVLATVRYQELFDSNTAYIILTIIYTVI